MPEADGPEGFSDRDITDIAMAGAGMVAGMGEAVVTGGTSVSAFIAVLGSAIGYRRRKEDERTLRAISTELERVKDRLNAEFVESDDFVGLTDEIIESSRRAGEGEKRSYYVGLWGSIATAERPDPTDYARMVDTLERLRISHLWLLRELMRAYDRKEFAAVEGMLAFGFRKVFVEAHPGLNGETLWLDYRDMEQAGMLEPMPIGAQSHEEAMNFRRLVTDFGKRFHEFVILPYSDVHPPT